VNEAETKKKKKIESEEIRVLLISEGTGDFKSVRFQ
jgi:hypothetical protein